MIVLLAGGSASGKSTLADALADRLRGARDAAVVIHLDQCVRPDLDRTGPWTPPDALGHRAPDVNHPAAFDWSAILEQTARAADEGHVIVEGLFALADNELRRLGHVHLYLDTPADLRLGRKIVRNLRQRGQAPELTLSNYLRSGRPGHEAHVAPTRAHADRVLDGTRATEDLVCEVLGILQGRVTTPSHETPAARPGAPRPYRPGVGASAPSGP